MVVKTKFSKGDFNKILTLYDLGIFHKSTSLNKGAVQTNILLEAKKGKFVFRYYENRTRDYALYEAGLLNYLAEKHYPSPVPIKSKDGQYIGDYKGKPFAIIEFMEGEHDESRENHKQVAKVIGQLHKATVNYKPEHFEIRDAYDPASCLKSADTNADKLQSQSKAKERLGWLKENLKKLDIPVDLPKGVCHCDTHPTNFLYKNGEVCAVLDFDDSSYVYLLYDIANMIYFWAWQMDEPINFDKVREILAEYEKYRKLTETEKTHLYDVLKMVNFMSIGWFIHEKDFEGDKKRIEELNSIGREEFKKKLFG